MEIDQIFEMLASPDENVWQVGITEAAKVRSVHVFLQPHDPVNNKNVWGRCATVLAARTDAELRPYLGELLEWLQDMNWPGAPTILERLRAFEDVPALASALKHARFLAQATGDDDWMENLQLTEAESDRHFF